MSDNQSTAVANLFGGQVSVRDKASVRAAMADSASKDPRGSGPDGSVFLNFSGKSGNYTFGPDQDPVSPEDLWLVDVNSFQDGFICWKGGRPIARRFASVFDAPVQAPDPTEHGPFNGDGEGWSAAKMFILVHLESGQIAQFSNNSKSGVSAIAGLQKQIAAQMATGNPGEWPVVTLDKEAFTASTFRNYKPVIEVEYWLTSEEVEEVAKAGPLTRDELDQLLDGGDSEPEYIAPEPEKKASPARRRRS